MELEVICLWISFSKTTSLNPPRLQNPKLKRLSTGWFEFISKFLSVMIAYMKLDLPAPFAPVRTVIGLNSKLAFGIERKFATDSSNFALFAINCAYP